MINYTNHPLTVGQPTAPQFCVSPNVPYLPPPWIERPLRFTQQKVAPPQVVRTQVIPERDRFINYLQRRVVDIPGSPISPKTSPKKSSPRPKTFPTT